MGGWFSPSERVHIALAGSSQRRTERARTSRRAFDARPAIALDRLSVSPSRELCLALKRPSLGLGLEPGGLAAGDAVPHGWWLAYDIRLLESDSSANG